MTVGTRCTNSSDAIMPISPSAASDPVQVVLTDAPQEGESDEWPRAGEREECVHGWKF